jgi:serine/threonine protein phosphatase 1
MRPLDPPNSMTTRTIAIGDIHGCSNALFTLLNLIEPTAKDTIILLGDYVDRGPDSAGVVDMLTDLVSNCNLIPLLGNHEIMMAQAFDNRSDYDFWRQNGGQATLNSYGGLLSNVPVHHQMFFNHCVRYYETETHIFTHASYNPALPLEKQRDESLFWEHILDDVPAPHRSGKIAVVGHTPQERGAIRDLGHIKMIDTFCYGDGWLTAFDVNAETGWQARNTGEHRLWPHEPKDLRKLPAQ